MSYGNIYKITNNVNGKIYIGRTTKDIETRFNQHCAAAEHESPEKLLLVQRAIKKYGRENFTLELLFVCETVDDYEIMEQFFISKYDARNSLIGYNIHEGGTGGDTVTCLPEDKYAERSNKIASAHKGLKLFNDGEKQFWIKPEDIQDALDNGYTQGKLNPQPLAETTKRKISSSLLGHRGAFLGRVHTEETKSKIGAAHKGLTHTEETKKKISVSKIGKKMSEDVKQRMSEQRRGRPKSEEHKKHIGDAHRGRPKSESTKEKLSQAFSGRKWMNNGVVQFQAVSEQIADLQAAGYVFGMLKR